ncbi:MAG: penicillin-binding protein 2 [Patescibacteria group bacterium]|jgi:penicillin-binding protein 2|nr:penicillin-binding protein 2 [Patescibacteria group bacterium]
MRNGLNSNPFGLAANRKFDGYFLNDRQKGKWFEVDLLNEKGSGVNKKVRDSFVSDRIINFWMIVLIGGLLILGGRTAYMQVIQGDHFRAVAEGNRIRIRDIKASRGVIYDRYQNLLLENVSSFSLAIVPVDLPNDEIELTTLLDRLSQITGKSVEEINDLLAGQSDYSYQPVILAENLNHDQATMVEIISSEFPAVILRSASFRHYLTTPTLPSLSHILGYVGKIEENKKADYLQQGYLIDDYVGKSGLELFYEKTLKGINGKEQVEVDAFGEAKEILARQEPLSGNNLVLTIDSELQRVAEESLNKVLTSQHKGRGAVVIMNPNSGEILSLVSLPGFDNNLFSQGISQENFSNLINDENKPLFNRAISGEYPSGSTFKLIVAAAALQEGLVNPNTGVNSSGGISVGSWFFPDWKAGGHGWSNLYKALAESVNTYFYLIGGGYNDFKGLGIDKIRAYAEKLGLSKPLNIDLPNEAAGFLPSPEWKQEAKGERWYIGDTYNFSIGQGDILVTPLQVANWTAFFANGGVLYKPYLVKEVLDSNNNVISEIKPTIVSQGIVSVENIKAVNRGLRQGVTDGSSRGLSNLPIKVAAKTGTAQWSSKYEPHAWLTAFAPYDNPQIVVTVLVEEGEEGSTVALPVARDILLWWSQHR